METFWLLVGRSIVRLAKRLAFNALHKGNHEFGRLGRLTGVAWRHGGSLGRRVWDGWMKGKVWGLRLQFGWRNRSRVWLAGLMGNKGKRLALNGWKGFARWHYVCRYLGYTHQSTTRKKRYNRNYCLLVSWDNSTPDIPHINTLFVRVVSPPPCLGNPRSNWLELRGWIWSL